MATKPTRPQKWPYRADATRKLTIDHADAALQQLDKALRDLDTAMEKLYRRAHPAETALDISIASREVMSAARALEIIKRLMSEAKNGVDPQEEPHG